MIGDAGDVIIQYASDNVAPNASTIGVQSGVEDQDYPASYLNDEQISRPAKIVGTSGSWVLSFAAKQRVDLVALGPHNLTSATIQAHNTNVWTAPTLSVAMTIPARNADGHSVGAWKDLTNASGYTTEGFYFWRLLVGSTTNPALGELWLGALKRIPSRAYQWIFTIEHEYPVIEHYTEFLVPHIFGVSARQRRFRCNFRASDAGALELQSWYASMRGATAPALFIPDSDVNEAWWIRHGQAYAETPQITNARDVDMLLVEHSTGVPL